MQSHQRVVMSTIYRVRNKMKTYPCYVYVWLNDLDTPLVCYTHGRQRILGLVQQLSTAMTVELTADSGSSIALISAQVDSGVFSLSIHFPCRQN